MLGKDRDDDRGEPGDNESGDVEQVKAKIEDIVSANVKALREGTGLSQFAFGLEAGVGVKKLEAKGGRGRPETLWKIARAAGLPLWWVYVDRTSTKAPPELQQFMEMAEKTGKEVTTAEYEYLVALPVMLNRTFSYDAFYKAFEMLRASKPNPPEGGGT